MTPEDTPPAWSLINGEGTVLLVPHKHEVMVICHTELKNSALDCSVKLAIWLEDA